MSIIETVELVLILTIVCLLLSLFIFLYLCEKILTDEDDYSTIYNTIYECLLNIGSIISCFSSSTPRHVIVPIPNNIEEPPRTIEHIIIENPMGLITLGRPCNDET
jgi:hypothetical protein